MNTTAQWYAAQARIAELEKALRDLVESCTPINSEPNNRGQIRSVRTPAWEIVQNSRAALNKETA